MERKRGLKGLFIKYLISWLICSFLLITATFLLFLCAIEAGFIYPANYGQIQLEQSVQRLENAEKIEEDDVLPPLKYALFTKGGQWKEGTLSGKEAEEAWEVSHRNYTGTGQTFYRVLEREDEILIIRYQLKSFFVNPVLQKILPSADTVIFVLMFLEGITCLLFMAVRFAKMLERNMAGIQTAIEKIEKEDLEFQVPNCGIREVDRLGEALERMRQALKDSLTAQWKEEKARQEQISALAHDLKTPLTVARGYTELLTEGELNEEEKADADVIEASIRQMQGYVEQLLYITKGSPLLTPVLTSVGIREFAESIRINLQGMSSQQGVNLEYEMEGTDTFVFADQERLERAVLNIASNGIEYAGRDGKVRFRVKSSPEGVVLSVEDSGPGFSKEALVRAREEFYTGSRARTGGNHSGLGLYIADNIVREHGGELRIGRSAELGGACVEVCLPAVSKE